MSTAKVNYYSYDMVLVSYLITNCVGQPVGWCISDSEAGDVIGAFLGAIQGHSPSTSVNVIIPTDDGILTLFKQCQVLLYANYSAVVDNTGLSAAKAVFGDSLKHLLCHWHVDR